MADERWKLLAEGYGVTSQEKWDQCSESGKGNTLE